MNLSRTYVITVTGAVALALLVVGVTHLRHKPMAPQTAKLLPSERPKLESYIAAHASDPSPRVQDAVATERMRLAYLEAHDTWSAQKAGVSKTAAFEAARKTFQQTAKEYKGTGATGADFGSIPDQAAYEAAVCLVAEGKTEAAKGEFVAFLKERPLSPLCKACYRRLVRLNGGKPTAEDDALIQSAEVAQEKHVKFELSVCGPKAIAAVLPMLGKPKTDYQAIAKLCGTTDKGTTMEGLRQGLKKLGIPSFALQVNVDDFAKLPTPAILLENSHYVVLTKVSPTTAEYFDPVANAPATMKLPKPDDPDFLATVITFSPPTLGVN